jgi:sugar diacid utilization regulator
MDASGGLPVEGPLTLGRLLQERALRGVRAEVSKDVLDRQVMWCLPWEEVLVDEGPVSDLLVFAHAEQVDRAGLRQLERRDVTALLVAGECAAKTAVPVLTAGEQLGFREVSRLVADLSLARETHVLRYGLTVHRSLVELLYRGAGLAALCHQMARLAGSPAAVLDPQFRVLAFEQGRDRVYEPSTVATAFRASAPPLPENAEHTPSHACVLPLDAVEANAVVNPILLGGRHDGWVLVLEPADPPPHPHDTAEHRVVVEQGATIIGTEMLRLRSVEQAEERARGDFVHALLHARFATAADLEARSTYYDFPTASSYGVVVVGGLHKSGGSTESLTAMFQLARDATRFAPRSGMQTLATVVGDVLAVVRQVEVPGRGASPDAANREMGAFANLLDQELTRRARHPVAVAYGRPVVGAMKIFDSYREARLTLALRNRLGIEEVCGFQDLRVYATLTELATSSNGIAFARDVLAPLRTQRHGPEGLEQAVLAYIRNGGNLNAAARELHIHRNTMLYKLDRASRALHLDLRQAEHQFTVWLAQKLDLLAETTQAVDRDVNPT